MWHGTATTQKTYQTEEIHLELPIPKTKLINGPLTGLGNDLRIQDFIFQNRYFVADRHN